MGSRLEVGQLGRGSRCWNQRLEGGNSKCRGGAEHSIGGGDCQTCPESQQSCRLFVMATLAVMVH